MLRIIGFVLLLIISRISFADTIAATSSTLITYKFLDSWGTTTLTANSTVSYALACDDLINQANGLTYKTSGGDSRSVTISSHSLTGSSCTYSYTSVSTSLGQIASSGSYTVVGSQSSAPSYVCPSGYYQSDASGTASSTAAYCTKTADKCESIKGTVYSLNVSATAAPSTVCFDSCQATKGTTVSFPDSTAVYQALSYTMSGVSCTAADDAGTYVDDATSTAANAAAKAAAKVEAEKKACGGEGYYTTGTANGATVVTCIDPKTTTSNSSTTSSSSTAEDGTTTDTTSTNSSSSTSSGLTGTTTGSTTSTTTTVVKNPDGTTTTTTATTETSADKACSADSTDVSCASLGEAASGALSTQAADMSYSAQSWGSGSATCPKGPTVRGITISYQPFCDFLTDLRPVVLALAGLIAAYILFGVRTGSDD
jgi:hypothetical protein